MLKLCIFDMDGTVVNSLTSIAYFANRTLEQHGFSPYPEEDYKIMVGNGAAKLVQRMVSRQNGTDAQTQAVYRDYVAAYDEDPLYLAAPYDGILDLLRALRARGVAVAILSNKPHDTTRSISDALFGSLVDACVGGRSDVPLKPAPNAVFQLMQLFGVSAEECLYIGDTGTDMQTAKNAGLFSVGVTWGFRTEDELRKAHANAIIHAPHELLSVADTYK